MITAVDTNILLDILIPNTRHVETSRRLLDQAFAQGALIICDVVYAELGAQFPTPQALAEFLVGTGIRLESTMERALAEAGTAWKKYCRSRKPAQCPACGTSQELACQRCHAPLRFRQHIMSDFLIGAHAQIRAQRLLTRDLGYYRTYFPELTLMQ